MKAKRLSQGGVIGICSPSHIAQYDDYQNTIQCIRNCGFEVREANNLYKNTHGYAATPEERAADFNQLVADPEVDLILFGGGEGANELLPHINFENLKQNPILKELIESNLIENIIILHKNDRKNIKYINNIKKNIDFQAKIV